MVVGTLALSQEPKIWGAIETLLGSGSEKQVHCVFSSDNKHNGVKARALVKFFIPEGLFEIVKDCLIQSNLAIRNFLVALKLFLNAKSFLSL